MVLTPGQLNRATFAPLQIIDGTEVRFYPSRLSVDVDLFTNGRPVMENGAAVAYEDCAVEELAAFSSFLQSTRAVEWCASKDIAVQVNGDLQDMTGILNENSYDYRARMSLQLYFTQAAIGRAGILDEDSLVFNPDSGDGNTGEPGHPGSGGPGDPQNPEGGGGAGTGGSSGADWKVVPQFTVTPAGGGTPGLAEEETGYFTSAEVTSADTRGGDRE